MSRHPLFHADDRSAVLPAALEALTDLRARGLAHRFVRHVRSSQAFALSLFAPLDEAGTRLVLAHLGHPDIAELEPPFFEYEDTSDRLQETSKRSSHRTQVDVLLRGTTTAGRRIAALIEVKLSETNFGACTAFSSPDNPDRDVCGQPGLFGGEPTRCFQLRNHGHGHRMYAEYLAKADVTAPTPRADDGGCWVRTGRNQPMRNLALAHVLTADGEFDEVVFALCAPRGHVAMWRRFHEFQSLFCDTDAVTVRALPAEAVARAHPDGGTALINRYGAALRDTALLHLSPDGTRLLGVWLFRGGHLTSHYAADTEADAGYARTVVHGEDWDALLERLPQSAPYVAWWERADCRMAETAADVFKRVRSDRFGA